MSRDYLTALRSVADQLLKHDTTTHRYAIFFMEDHITMRVAQGPTRASWLATPNSDPEHRLVEISKFPEDLRDAILAGRIQHTDLEGVAQPLEVLDVVIWVGFGMGVGEDDTSIEKVWPGLAYDFDDCTEAAEDIARYLESGVFPELLDEYNKKMH